MWKSKVVSFWTPVHLNDWNRNSWNSCSLWPQQGRYLGGGQLSGSPAAAAERVDSSGHGPAARLKVDGGRLQWLQARHRLLSVNVCGYHGNGSLGRHHGDGDALTGRLDERQRLSRPNRTASDRQLLQRDRRETDRWDRQITAREEEWDGERERETEMLPSVCEGLSLSVLWVHLTLLLKLHFPAVWRCCKQSRGWD